jgi:uncharacterized membrane protein
LSNQTSYYPQGITVSGNDLYIVGYQYTPAINQRKAWYWNGDTINLLPIAQLSSSTATGIAVSGDDVYISGYYSDGSKSQACYWKNNVLHELDDGRVGMDSFASAVTVINNDLYFLGMNCYWLNGNKISLPADGVAFDIAVVAKN